MTRKETRDALDELKSTTKYDSSFQHYCSIYTQGLYEATLKYGVDPESEDVYFYYDIQDGKGTKWIE